MDVLVQFTQENEMAKTMSYEEAIQVMGEAGYEEALGAEVRETIQQLLKEGFIIEVSPGAYKLNPNRKDKAKKKASKKKPAKRSK
jgi:hypothetical protein